MQSTKIVLARRPVGEPEDACFGIVHEDIPALGEGQILIKVLWLSLDPYMRGRMNDAKSYAKPLEIGDIMPGETAGVVLQSRSAHYAVGDHVTTGDRYLHLAGVQAVGTGGDRRLRGRGGDRQRKAGAQRGHQKLAPVDGGRFRCEIAKAA